MHTAILMTVTVRNLYVCVLWNTLRHCACLMLLDIHYNRGDSGLQDES